MTEPRIPFLLTIDAEPDPAEIERHTTEPWVGFERCIEIVERLRPTLERATGRPAHFTWALRIDDQVAEAYGSMTWVVDRYGTNLEALRAKGDALGIHPHAWRWSDDLGRWFQDHADGDWVEGTIRRSAAAFEATLGPCRIHRYGSHYLDARIVGVLREIGIAVDLTPEPGSAATKSLGAELTTGLIPDQQAAPDRIYHPDPADPFAALPERDGTAPTGPGGPDDLWIIGNTSFDPASLMPAWRRVARRVRYPGRSPVRPIHLYSGLAGDRYWRVVGDHARSLERPFLSFSLRSDAPLRAYWPAVQEKLDGLLRDPLLPQLVFATPAETIEQLDGS